jgi:hypothetical protein
MIWTQDTLNVDCKDFLWNTANHWQHNMAEDRNPHSHCHENMKSPLQFSYEEGDDNLVFYLIFSVCPFPFSLSCWPHGWSNFNMEASNLHNPLQCLDAEK